MERLLGMFKGNNFIVLSVRFARGPNCRFSTKAFDNRWWCYYATDTRASKTRLHILFEHCIWRCVPVSGSMPGKTMIKKLSTWFVKSNLFKMRWKFQIFAAGIFFFLLFCSYCCCCCWSTNLLIRAVEPLWNLAAIGIPYTWTAYTRIHINK